MSTRTYLGMVAAEDLSDMQYKILNVHGANTVKLRVAAGAGVFTRVMIHETKGVYLGTGDEMTAEGIEANWDQISDMTDATLCYQGGDQSMKAFTLIQESKK